MSRITLDSGRKTGDDDDDDGSGALTKWEGIYWSHFSTVHFFQNLTGRFYCQLAIPQKFVNNVTEKLAGSVELQGPSGVVWNVGLTAYGRTLYLKDGWKQFVDDHSLQENDVLIFKYSGNSHFDVLMFDQESMCEKEGSYFVNRPQDQNNGEVNSIPEMKAKSQDTLEVTKESSHDFYEGGATSKKPKTEDTGTSRCIRWRHERTNQIGLKGKTSAYGKELSSKRRTATKEEKQEALKKAIVVAEVSDTAAFLMIMLRSHVHSVFYMSIPAEWASMHLPCRRQYKHATLQVEEKKWMVKFHLRKAGCGLAGGWKRFAKDNHLQESDVCLFKLVSKTADGIVMDVSFFRAIEEEDKPATPPPASSRVIIGGLGRGRKVNGYGIDV